jgi:hypothetical protein
MSDGGGEQAFMRDREHYTPGGFKTLEFDYVGAEVIVKERA